jgi:hypothetical protein
MRLIWGKFKLNFGWPDKVAQIWDYSKSFKVFWFVITFIKLRNDSFWTFDQYLISVIKVPRWGDFCLFKPWGKTYRAEVVKPVINNNNNNNYPVKVTNAVPPVFIKKPSGPIEVFAGEL